MMLFIPWLNFLAWAVVCWCSKDDTAYAYLVPLLILMGVLHAAHAYAYRQHTVPWKPMLIIAILCRIFSLFSTPILEDDYYRYLWDGIVTSQIDNALIISPTEMLRGPVAQDENTARASLISRRESYLPDRKRKELLNLINYPESPSIYGPVAQIFLGLQNLPWKGFHALWPKIEIELSWRLHGLRVFLLLAEGLALLLFYQLLCHIGANPFLLWVFATSPLLLKEVGNSIHIDILAVAFLLGSYLSLLKHRQQASWILLALALGVKPFVLVLIPLWLFYCRKTWLGCLSAFLLTLICIYTPYLLSGGMEIFCGSQYFAWQWSMNDGLTALIRELGFHSFTDIHPAIELYPIGTVHISMVHQWSRFFGLIFFAFFALGLLIKRRRHLHESSCFLGTIADLLFLVYLCSPVQNPWYLLWSMPFSILSGRWLQIFYGAIVQFYLYNFFYTPTDHLLHDPFQWWVLLPQGLLLIAWFGPRWFIKPIELI